ncbi:MAG: PD40 domain-containing protein [Fibrobacteres bacterium]|nr:PD40 domain-containing protein [Fibrobacterota bacterium]
MKKLLVGISTLALATSLLAGPPKGKSVEAEADEVALFSALKGKINAKIVWSTSRDDNHDIFIMNGDGTDVKPLTRGPKTDWFSRFSPDGQQVIFTRSKMDWTAEPNADNPQLWDTWIINVDGTGEKLLIPNSTWATWRPDGKTIIFSRAGEVYSFDIASGAETLIMKAEDGLKKGAILQNPHMSPNGKYLAITLRGSMRETGLWDIANKSWTKVGEGCQINWFPSGDSVIRMNSSGNGGSEVLAFAVKDGKPADPKLSVSDIRFIDRPGRRSHEYFPQVSSDGQWLVWASTQRGHDHDIADYELDIWKIGTPKEEATRLTFHSGNDRWPDIFMVK